VKAIRVHACGGPEAMALEDLPLPVPAKGQVLIAVKAAGVNLSTRSCAADFTNATCL
jgi:NADPH2:quinone reductase